VLERLDVRCTLLPVTDDPLRTMVDTQEHGTLPFQEYFVRHQWQPTAQKVCFMACMMRGQLNKVVGGSAGSGCDRILPVESGAVDCPIVRRYWCERSTSPCGKDYVLRLVRSWAVRRSKGPREADRELSSISGMLIDY